MLSEDGLARLEKLEREASPAPWSVDVLPYEGVPLPTLVHGPLDDPSERFEVDTLSRPACDFLAEVRNALPGLIAAAREAGRYRQLAEDADRAKGEGEALEKALRQALASLRAWEQWEADLINSDEAWGPNGMASNPKVTDDLLERLTPIQYGRKDAIRGAEAALGGGVREDN
jgi:hypothetical protein